MNTSYVFFKISDDLNILAAIWMISIWELLKQSPSHNLDAGTWLNLDSVFS